MTYKELSRGFIVEYGIPHRFRIKITFINDRKCIQHDLKKVLG